MPDAQLYPNPQSLARILCSHLSVAGIRGGSWPRFMLSIASDTSAEKEAYVSPGFITNRFVLLVNKRMRHECTKSHCRQRIVVHPVL